jgi:hypothetical protein
LGDRLMEYREACEDGDRRACVHQRLRMFTPPSCASRKGWHKSPMGARGTDRTIGFTNNRSSARRAPKLCRDFG